METDLQEYLQQAVGDAYGVERELGGGGMSRVFLAVERSLGRRVVIKALPPELFSGVNEARFQREILVTANLQHPHILPVLAVGAREDVRYYVTPYVEGRTLRARLAFEGALPIGDAVTILRELAGALAYAHDRGVIHRDVKPENILLSEGHAVLADFGIARAVEQASQVGLTGAGHGLGTPGYMAPEQMAGDPTVDARADVFALGVVGYEMLAGRAPFTGATPHALATAYFTEPPVPIRQLRPDTPVAVATAITRALARAPEERFANASGFRDALLPATGPARQRRQRVFRLTLGAAVAAALVLGVGLGRHIGDGSPERGAPARKTLAVLPFKNLGPPEDAYFADGITEELTSRLAGLSGLGVISRTSADQYRNSPRSLREIAAELGADYVLEGSVRWERGAGGHGRVRVTPQLIRVRDDSHLWADRFDAELSDVFDVQSQIAERVATALAITFGGDERRRMDARPTENLDAYDSYMRGERLRVRESSNAASLVRAAELLSEAAAADPRFALAFARLSMTHGIIYESFIDRTPQRLAQARAAADSALALDPSLPEAHAALGDFYIHANDFQRAGMEYAIAERGRPNDTEIIGRMAGVLVHRGRWPEALARLRRAAELNPRSVDANANLAVAAALTRDYGKAGTYVERALAADPDAVGPYVLKAHLQLVDGDRARARESAREIIRRFGVDRAAAAEGFDALLPVLDTTDRAALANAPPSAFGGRNIVYLFWRIELFHSWHPERASAYADSLLVAAHDLIRDQPDNYRVHGALGWIHAIQGRPADAVREARRSVELAPRSRDAVTWADAASRAAVTFVLAGDADAAIEQLEQLLGAPSFVSVAMLRTDPMWAPLRGKPRFERLLARRS